MIIVESLNFYFQIKQILEGKHGHDNSLYERFNQYVTVEYTMNVTILLYHDDVMKWKHFPLYWPFVCGEFTDNSLAKACDAELWYFLWWTAE